GRLPQRPLGPRDRGLVVARAEREPAHLLEEVGALDRIALLAEPIEARGEAGGGPLAVARLPVETPELPEEPGRERPVAGPLARLADGLEVGEGLRAASGQPEQIAQPLADRRDLAVAVRALGEGAQGALVVPDRVVVGVHRARPVARGHEV